MSAATIQPPLPRGRAMSLAWLASAGCILAVFIALVPLNLRDIGRDWQVVLSHQAVYRLASARSFGLYFAGLRYAAAAVFFVTAAVIYWNKSDDWMALFTSLVLLLMPLAFGLGGYTNTWDVYAPAWRPALEASRQVLATLGPTVFAVWLFLFPDGQFVPRWTRWAALGGTALLLALGALMLVQGASNWVWPAWTSALLVTLSLAAAAQVYRYRRVSTAIQRQQTKLVVFGFAAVLAGLLLTLGLGLFVTARARPFYMLVFMHLDLLFLVLIPLTLAVSILRYRLWDIDLIVNRALVYGALTVVVVGLYGLVVGVVGAFFQVGGSLLMSALATGLIAVLFQPVRQWLQRGVNRLMYGERDDPVTVLARLGQHLQTAAAPEAVLPNVAETVAEALKLPYAAVALKDGDAFRVAAEYQRQAGRQPASARAPAAESGPELVRLPLVHQSDVIGQLIVAPRAPGEALTPADRRLLEEVAQKAGASVQAARLTTDLQRSRERLVTAREEERRRLRRDLHDELGPTLAGQAFRLDAALDLLEADRAAARALLVDLKAQTQATVADIRRLVYALRPPALDELGLVSAIQEQAARCSAADHLRVSVQAPPEGLPSLSAAVEVAAYRIALEALTNVSRHAQAREAVVRLSVSGNDRPGQPAETRLLRLEVSDDGAGLPPDHHVGVGLSSMRERAAELGGTCVIESAAGRGTRVVARLPLMDPPAAKDE